MDPLLRDTARNETAVTEQGSHELDDAVIAPLSELLAYAPLNRGRSSTVQARATADDQEDRMPLFLERDDPAADDGFHFKQREPERRDESRQDPDTAYPSAHLFDPEPRQTAPDSFTSPGFFWYAAWAGAAAFMVVVIFGGLVFFGGAFSGSLPPAESIKQVAQAATAPIQSPSQPVSSQPAISFDQTFAAIPVPTPPAKKPDVSDPGASRPADGTVATAVTDGKPQTDKTNARAPASPAAADPPRQIDQAELASLLKRGRELVDVGDIASARLLLQRAADARVPQAAFALAGTYDPAVLSRVKAYGIAPDLAMARIWYEKAREFGSSDAQQRLEQLPK
jgi:hypothetical protein